MEIKSFIDEYNKIVSDKLKKDYLDKNIKKDEYVSFSKKLDVVRNIAKSTTHKYDKDGKETGIRVNSAARYILFTLNVIDLYTNLEIDFKNSVNEYDMLAENRLVKELLELIPEYEIADFKTLLDMCVEDIMTNELSASAFISSQITRFGNLIGITLEPALNQVAQEIANLDDSKIEAFEKQMNKVLKRVK